jgi:hypothetical protein
MSSMLVRYPMENETAGHVAGGFGLARLRPEYENLTLAIGERG